jgi:hypothetical protein
MSVIEDAISKYSGGDEAYAQKLKTHMRDAMGYSNYMSKIGQETAKPAAIGDIKGLSPSGISARIGTRFGMQDQNISTLNQVAGAIDTTAGQLANDQVSREKAAAREAESRVGVENGVAFTPQNQIETEILKYIQNPKNEDGTIKTPQQFEEELKGMFKEIPGADKPYDMGDGNVASREVYDENQVKEALAKRLPKDYAGNEDKYFMMSRGFSEKQARENAGALRYDTSMTAPEKLIYEVQHPEMSKMLAEGKNVTGAINDVTATTTGKNGEVQPTYSFTELKERNPQLTDAELKDMALPVYKQNAQDELSKELKRTYEGEAIIDNFKNSYLNGFGDKEIKGLEGIKASDAYKELVTKFNLSYGDILSTAEMERMILSNVMTNLQ